MEDKLENKVPSDAKFLAEYITEKKPSTDEDRLYHCLFYAFEHNYKDIVKILLNIKFNHSLSPFGTCWNSNCCCIEKNPIISGIYNFITKNIDNKEFAIATILNIFIKTKYLNQSNIKILLFTKLMLNKDYRVLIDCIYKIIQQTYMYNGSFLISKLSEDANLISIAHNLNESCPVEQLDEKISNFKELSPSEITKCKKLYYNFKFNINIDISPCYEGIKDLYRLIKDLKENIFTEI